MSERNRILVTAGPVYGSLDSNKVISNRVRGLWATRFVPHILNAGYDVDFVVPDTMISEFRTRLGRHEDEVTFHVHSGYHSYASICKELADSHSLKGAVMAAAVVNYIPKNSFDGKMPTHQKEIMIPFVLAPKVINSMKDIDPKITLIGCKFLFEGNQDSLIDSAYKVILNGRCNAVVANDKKLGLKRKFIVHQDRTVTEYDNDFDGMYAHLIEMLGDEYYRTKQYGEQEYAPNKSRERFTYLADRYRELFVKRQGGQDFVLGAIATRMGEDKYLVSPREKGSRFTADHSVIVRQISDQIVHTNWGKASLNAPLLIRHLQKYPEATSVLHFHEDLEPFDVSTQGRSSKLVYPTLEDLEGVAYACVSHAPPGTVRDNERFIPAPTFYIKGHGWIVALDEKGNPLA